MHDYPDAESARREAFEEAGVVGRMDPHSLGAFDYWKTMHRERAYFQAHAFKLHVQDVLNEWPEKAARRRAWFSPVQAAQVVRNPGLGALILEACACAPSFALETSMRGC